MAYPKEIYLSKEREEAIKMWLIWQITNHRGERSAWVNELTRYLKDYWARPNQAVKTFPFQNAANIIIPITAIVAEAVHARNMQRMFSQDQLVSLKFFDPLWAPFDRDIERFLDWQMLDQMEFKKKFESALLEQEILGTGVVKDGYTRFVKNIVDAEGNQIETPIYAGPSMDAVPLVNFLMPFSSQDPQTAPWCGEEHVSNQFEIRQLEQSGFFRPGTYEKLNTHFTTANAVNLSSDKYRQKQEALQEQTPTWPSRVGWYEIYGGFAPTEGGKLVEYCFLYHFDSNTLMSVRHNWHENGRRPYSIGVMQKVANRWTGIGVAQQNEQFQREITMQHRQRLDAGTVANANMMKVKRLSGISPDEPVYPGKLWFVEDMGDIEPLQFSGTYPTAANNEQQTLYYGQQRSGIHDLTLGMAQVGTPGTATSDMARLQESGFKHDYFYHNVVDFATDIVKATVCNIAYFGTSDPRYYELIPNGEVVRQFFSMPSSLLKSGIICKIRVVTQSDNKLLDRNNWIQLTQIFQQYYQSAFQAASLINPELAKTVAAYSIQASTLAFEHILQSFDIPDATKLTLRTLIDGIIPQPDRPPGRIARATETPATLPVSVPQASGGEVANAIPPQIGSGG